MYFLVYASPPKQGHGQLQTLQMLWLDQKLEFSMAYHGPKSSYFFFNLFRQKQMLELSF